MFKQNFWKEFAQEAKTDTFKQFRSWLHNGYTNQMKSSGYKSWKKMEHTVIQIQYMTSTFSYNDFTQENGDLTLYGQNRDGSFTQ